MGVFDELEKENVQAAKPRWKGSFREFLMEFKRGKWPNAGVLSHQRVRDMIHAAGVEKLDHFGVERKRYKFFEETLYGIEDTIDAIMQYINSAADRAETSRRLLLLYGPVSTGKSNLVSLIKGGLEQYTRTEAGAIFAVEGSPMHENPFMLIPDYLREKFAAEYKVVIEGKLSPITQWRLDNEYQGKFMDFPVEQIYFSEAARVGIGTWLPSDVKCLTGDCLILTNKGLRRGNDVFLGNNSENCSAINPALRPTSLSRVFDNGIQPVYRVQLRGMAIEATSSHRFRVVNSHGEFEWCEVKDILGKSIPIAVGSNIFGDDATLERINEAVYTDKHHAVSLPEKMNPELARLVGYLIAGGRSDSSRIAFQRNDNINEDFRSILESQFTAHTGQEVAQKEKTTIEDQQIDPFAWASITINKQKVVDFINLNFEVSRDAHEKRIPKCILTSSKTSQIEFLEGLYLGNENAFVAYAAYAANANNIWPPRIMFDSFSEHLVVDIQAMLINMGIYSVISSYVDLKNKLHYRLATENEDTKSLAAILPRFIKNKNADWIFDNTDKPTAIEHRHDFESFGNLQGLIADIRSATRGSKEIVDRHALGSKNRRSPSRQTLQNWLTYLNSKDCQWVKPENAKSIIGRINNLLKYRCIPVVSVEYAGHKPVYDIEVGDPQHAFLVNGVISHNSQDLSELLGGLDYAKIQDVGNEADPRAYNFNGELNVANRGIMEFIEGLRADEKFLRANLTATQEKALKAPRFGLISVDCLIIMHTNEAEFINFMSEKKFEAYHDRMVMIPVKYNLSYSNEAKISQKLLNHSDALQNMHLSPHCLEVAGMFAVLTRLEPTEHENLIKKLKLYNKEHVKGRKIEEVPDLRKKSPREGMDGISPRFIIDQISIAISKAKEENRDYLIPLDILRQLHEGIRISDRFKQDDKQKFEEYLGLAREELNELIRNDIQKAFFLEFADEAKALCDTYLDHIEAALDHRKPRDPVTNEEIEVNTKLIESIEDQIGITNNGREDFRHEILRAFSVAARKNHPFDYTQHAQLREAIQKQLFHERQGVIRMTVSSRNPDPEGLKRINEVVGRMCDQQGYTPASANAILKYASSHLFEK